MNSYKKTILLIVAGIYGCAALSALLTFVIAILRVIGEFNWNWFVFWPQFLFYFVAFLFQIFTLKKEKDPFADE